MKVVVIEDEAPAARRLVKMIGEADPSLEVVAVLESVADSVTWFIANAAPDLIFSDIQLSDDLSFEIYKKLELKTPIIFTTAFDEYAIKAFKVHSVDYLLKPIKSKALAEAIGKFKEMYNSSPQLDMAALMNSLQQKDYRTRFLVHHRENLFPVPCESVAYCYSEDGATFLRTFDDRRYIISETLDLLETQLDPQCFFRLSRQFIVQVEAVQTVQKHFNQKLKVQLQPAPIDEVLVSKSKATAFKDWLNR